MTRKALLDKYVCKLRGKLKLAGVAGGSAGDGVARFGLKRTFRIALLANAVACALLGFAASQWWALLLSALLFGSTFILITGLFGIWSVHVFQERPSAGFGATFFLISAGQLISPAIAGTVAGHLGLGWIFELTALGTLAVMGCLPRGDIRQMSDANSELETFMSHEHLEDIVKTSLGALAPLSIDDIDTLSNTDKYALRENYDTQNDAELENIFGYMAELNEAAVNSHSLCAGQGKASIRDCLCRTADFIATHSHGKPIRYIEIGPEPHKTKLILERLEECNIELGAYVGIDLNPKSEMPMYQALEPIIDAERFHYMIADYNNLTADDLETYEGLTVVTMLGFQEGNETPEKMAGILAGLTQPGDLLLSEMQLSSSRGYGPIIDFYNSHPMRQFSDSVCKRNQVVAADQHSIFVIPIDTRLGGMMVAATIVPYKHNGLGRYLLTNCCLKYTRQQFKEVREREGAFRVIEEFLTGDETVTYQFAIRC